MAKISSTLGHTTFYKTYTSLLNTDNKIAVADSSESYWDTTKRYDANPIASDTNGESFVQSPYKWAKLYSFHIRKTLHRKLKFKQHEPHDIVI